MGALGGHVHLGPPGSAPTPHILYLAIHACVHSVRNEGGHGGLTPLITAQDPGICPFQGAPGWVP